MLEKKTLKNTEIGADNRYKETVNGELDQKVKIHISWNE